MSNNKKWSIVGIYTLLIFASLPVARQMWDFVGDKNGFFIMVGLFIGSAGLLYIRFRNIFLIGLIGVITLAIFRLIPLPIERIHFIEYGILGWLAYWAGGKKAFIYIIVIGILDEIIQGILPNRYFDMRDIYMNIIGGFLGMVIRAYER